MSEERKEPDREDKIRELKQKIKRLEEEAQERKRFGATSGLLRGLGSLLPGLDKLIEGLEGSEAFQQRLEAIDEEIEARLREAPSRGEEKGRSTIPSKGSIPGRSPMHVKRGFSLRTLAEEHPFEVKTKKPEPKREREVLVDIFDEENHLKVIAELPGVEEKDIETDLEGNTLSISADSPSHRYYKEIALPCSVKGELKTAYRNGILEIELEKAEEQ